MVTMTVCAFPIIGRRTAMLALLSSPWLASPAQATDALYRAEAGWLDDRGQPFELSRLQGSWTVMTMAYGACRRICSTSLRLMQQAQQLADSRHQPLNFVVLGLDPSQDTPADWARFRAQHRLERANWSFLSGDAAATRNMAVRLGIHYWRYGEHTMHDFRIVLLTPQGDIARVMVAFDQPVSMLLPGT
jgi:protein SCO1/2